MIEEDKIPKKERYTEKHHRDKAIYKNYLQVLKELGRKATLYPVSEIYRLTALKPLPETYLTPKYIGIIIQRKKAKRTFYQNNERNTLKAQKNEAIYQNYLNILNQYDKKNTPSEIELYRLTSLEPLPQSFIKPERVGRIINSYLTGYE